jgi:hypothetical protein
VVIDGGRCFEDQLMYGAGWILNSLILNEAGIDGWMVLRFTVGQVEDETAMKVVARMLVSPWRRV